MKKRYLLSAFGAVLALNTVLASAAYAQGDPAQPGIFASLAPLIIIMLIFYFLLIRPQQKRLKDHKKMVSELKKGDQVVTGGGLIGTIADVKDDIIRVEIADGVKVKVKRDTIASAGG